MSQTDIKRFFEGLPLEEMTCLDLGCGEYTGMMETQVAQLPFKELVSVDAWAPALEQHKDVQFAAAKQTSVEADIRDLTQFGSFDIILAFDVLEHLTKAEGHKFLGRLEKKANNLILLLVPVEPGVHRPWEGRYDNPYQEHKAFWTPSELTEKGYDVEILENFQNEPGIGQFDAMWAIKRV